MAETEINQQKLTQNSYNLDTITLKGVIKLKPDFVPRYVAVLNSSAATIYIKDGVLLDRPKDVIGVNPGVYLSYPIPQSNEYSLFWESPAFMSDATNDISIMFSDKPILLQGGKMNDTASGSANVSVVNIPTVNIGGEVEVKNDAGNPLVMTIPSGVGINGEVEVKNDSGNPLSVSFASAPTVNIGTIPEVEIKNDSGNPLPVSGTVVANVIPKSGNGVLTGTQTVGTSAAVISTSQAAIDGMVVIQAANANAGTLFVGDATNQTFELKAGQQYSFPASNINKLYIKGSVASTVANWMVGN